MRLISKSDMEAIQISNVVIKSSARKKAYNEMMKLWQNERQNTDLAFQFATCALAFVYEEAIAPDRHKYLSNAIEALSDCINLDDNWWMARYMRGGALQAITVSSDGQFTQDTDVASDSDELIRKQRNSLQNEPYFLCPYLITAKSYIFQGKVDQAIEIAEQGLSEVIPKSMLYTLNILLQPFGDSILIFRGVGREDLAERIKKFGLQLFPKSASLAVF